MENWEVRWKDYYKILQVDFAAEQEVVKGAFDRLAKKYHPDVNKDPHANERMKDINEAYEVLGNLEKRSRYDSAWHQKQEKGAYGAKASVPPNPIVDPTHIQFSDVEPREAKKASFTIRNLGGSYSKIWVSNPDSWVKVIGWESLTASDELPLKVEIEAEGDDWDKNYSEFIRIRLDEEETTVKVDLQTKSQPAIELVSGDTVKTRAIKVLPVKSSLYSKRKRAIMFSVIGVIVFLVIVAVVSSRTQSTTSLATVPTSQAQTTKQTAQPLSSSTSLEKYKGLGIATTVSQIEPGLGLWINEKLGFKTSWGWNDRPAGFSDGYVYFEDYTNVGGHYWVVGDGDSGSTFIFHSPDGGVSWELKLREPRYSYFDPFAIYFLSELEGWVGGKDGLLYTQDGGKTWEARSVQGQGSYIGHYWFYSDGYIYAGFVNGGTYGSADGGKTWK